MVHLARSVAQGCSAETAAHENKPDLRKYSLELSSEAMRAEISKEVKPTRRGGKKKLPEAVHRHRNESQSTGVKDKCADARPGKCLIPNTVAAEDTAGSLQSSYFRLML